MYLKKNVTKSIVYNNFVQTKQQESKKQFQHTNTQPCLKTSTNKRTYSNLQRDARASDYGQLCKRKGKKHRYYSQLATPGINGGNPESRIKKGRARRKTTAMPNLEFQKSKYSIQSKNKTKLKRF